MNTLTGLIEMTASDRPDAVAIVTQLSLAGINAERRYLARRADVGAAEGDAAGSESEAAGESTPDAASAGTGAEAGAADGSGDTGTGDEIG